MIYSANGFRLAHIKGDISMKIFALVLLAFVLSAPKALFGQAVFGSISRNVTDASGALFRRPKITITDVGKGVTYNTTSNESGNYSQTHLIIGVYEIRIEAPGF